MIFQTLDDKSECVGVYVDGALHFQDHPTNLTKTWKYTGSIQDPNVEYAWLYCEGKNLAEVCPPELKEELKEAQSKFKAYLKAFEIGKINLRQICFFDLVPNDFLVEFCEVRNKITQHVFDNYDKPENYDHLDKVYKLLHKIRYQKLKINIDGCRFLLTTSFGRDDINKLINKKKPFLNYDMYGTITGRLSMKSSGFPLMTTRTVYRTLLKPNNDWFLSFDYNGAEVRTLLGLSDQEQPDEDIHLWNATNLFGALTPEREEAKVSFFAWLYNPRDDSLENKIYNKKEILKKYYKNDVITTPFGRKINVGEWKALNYLLQSTTSDLTLERAIAIDKFLENRKSYISHVIHDEIVIDLSEEDKELLVEMKDIFSNTKLGKYLVNTKVGKDYYNLKDLTL